MSLRAKLTWAFLVVALLALIPAAFLMNAGMYASTVGPWGPGIHRQMMSGGGMGMGRWPDVTSTEEPADSPRHYMETARYWSLWSSLAAFLLAGAAGYLTAGRITRPLATLRDAAQTVDLRDLSRRVPVEGKDEIADLAGSFNRMCDRLQAEEQARRSLVADVAHELRHPLAVLQGRLELMQDGKVELDQEALLPLQDEVIRLTRLVGDLRDLSLVEAGGLSLHLARVDLATLLDGLLTNLEPVAAAKAIQLTATVAPTVPAVTADPDRLRQVLVNLLANAIQYTPEGGRVGVRVALDGNKIEIQVRDTGAGIEPEDLPHVFDRFYRADKSRSRATGGTGLGLAIVRGLVQAHGGQVSVASRPGEGACFTVTLPAAGPGPKA
ncbi:MAG TPA: HAMP domain-containing sensor histidine kinase [Symbiobacteriaceae bacterium]|jgi:signal transduction histidine kinase